MSTYYAYLVGRLYHYKAISSEFRKFHIFQVASWHLIGTPSLSPLQSPLYQTRLITTERARQSPRWLANRLTAPTTCLAPS